MVLTSTNGLPLKPEPHRLFTFSEFLPSAAKWVTISQRYNFHNIYRLSPHTHPASNLPPLPIFFWSSQLLAKFNNRTLGVLRSVLCPNFVNFFLALSSAPPFYCSFLWAPPTQLLVIFPLFVYFRPSPATPTCLSATLAPLLATFVTRNGEYHHVEALDWISYCRCENGIQKEFDWFVEGSQDDYYPSMQGIGEE